LRIMEVEIKNWNKYNPRSDAKSCAWFRMSNDFFTDPDFYGANLEARMVWIFLLAASSKKMNAKIKINTQMIADSLSSRLESIDFAIEQLAFIGCISFSFAPIIPLISGPTVKKMLPDVTCPNVTNVTNVTERTNVTNNIPKFGSSDVIALLNSICFTTFRNGSGHARHINARINEGFTLSDFAQVIKFRHATWSNDPKMAPFLRPETLFGNKMDSYLQESKKPFKGKLAPSSENPTGDPYLAQLIENRKSGASA
jgi:uncharacterized phage protein (TIGR02220 family)